MFLRVLTKQLPDEIIVMGFVRTGAHIRVLLGTGLILLLDKLCFERRQIHSGKTEPGKNAVDLGGVLCPHHNGRNAIGGVFVFEDTIKNTVLLGLLAEFLKVPILDSEHFQLLAGAEHIGQTDFAFGFLLVFQNGVNHNRQLLGGGAGQFCRDFNAVQAQTDDLICRLAGIAHAVLPPFFQFPVPAAIAPDSAPSERNGLQFRHIISPPDAVFLSQRKPL